MLLNFIQDQFNLFVAFEGNNLHLSPANNPYYAFYCGKSFLLVKITNLRDQNLDSVPENNVLATSVTLKCPGGELLFIFWSLVLTLVTTPVAWFKRCLNLPKI